MGMAKVTVIVAIWRHRLNLQGLRKRDDVRLVVVGPAGLLVDEINVDVVYQVEGPITSRDENHSVLTQKVRELCASMPNTPRRLCAFERSLQKEIAQIRQELDIDGIRPEQFEQLMQRKDLKTACRRGGLSTLKFCSFGSVQGQPDAWVECAKNQVGSYPMFLRPTNSDINCMHTLHIARNPDELRSWIKARPKTSNLYMEYLVEECLENGHEFVVACSTSTGLIGTFTVVDQSRTFYTSVKSQSAYAVEYLSADQTRDVLPGVESFVIQSLKTFFTKSMCSLVFIKGFYKGHNTITFLSASLELRKTTFATLFREANHGKSWESFAVENLFDSSSANGSIKPETNGCGPSLRYAVINFPNSEGVLFHQSSIARRKSTMRVAWRVAEGEELLDADGIDDNVVQVYLSNSNRNELLTDIDEIIQHTDITIDKLSLLDKHNVCRRINFEVTRVSSSGNMLVRSCTTAD